MPALSKARNLKGIRWEVLYSEDRGRLARRASGGPDHGTQHTHPLQGGKQVMVSVSVRLSCSLMRELRESGLSFTSFWIHF